MSDNGTNEGSDLAPLKAPGLADNIAHGFFGRAGGLSTGVYRGLNCGLGSDDDAATVRANRARVANALSLEPTNLLTVYQIHSANVVTITEPHAYEDAPEADAMVTATPGLGLAILTADCAPILFADAEAGVIGAAHAGWKGAIGGVLANTVQAMNDLGANPARIIAAIGPTISQTNYEVGPEFKTQFLDQSACSAGFFVPSPKADHHQFDLPGFVANQLAKAGVDQITDTSLCTYADEQRYFSYRRSTHSQEADYGRNISVIALAP